MATNVVRAGISENGVAEEPRGKVQEIKKEWSVIEDGALAHRLQEEENVTHYSGNISRRRTVRSDMKAAKSAADEEAIKAFQEEHEIAERNRRMEMEDAEAAKKLLHEMMEEEKRKIREQRQRENEEADRRAAKELYKQMMDEEQRKVQSQKSFEETDAELALRLQAHEERKRQILSRKQRSLDQETESERLARQLAKEEQRSLAQSAQGQADEGMHHHRRRHKHKHAETGDTRDKQMPTDSRHPRDEYRSSESRHSRDKQRPTGQRDHADRHRPPEPGDLRDKHRVADPRDDMDKTRSIDYRESGTERKENRDGHLPSEPRGHSKDQRPREHKSDRSEQRPTETTEHTDQHRRKDYLVPSVVGLRVDVDDEPTPELPSRKHKPQRVPRQQSAPATTGTGYHDSDEETDVIAKIQDDEELARRLQREEIQKSRAPSQLTEKQRHQLLHDQKIAIKMQHEEVMFSNKSTYDNYMGKVKDEIADPEPMVHVSRQNKTAVPVDAKYGAGVQLTDYTAAEGAQQRRTSRSGHPGAEGNILASIDPTFNKRDTGNVVLIKKTSLSKEPQPGPESDFAPVQGSRRKESKDKGKRGSIFSKLKKK